jgi:hypothetical protein
MQTKNKFIELTECYSKLKKIYINVDMIGAIYKDGDRTCLKHLSHNNGGYTILETPEQILELIKKLN